MEQGVIGLELAMTVFAIVELSIPIFAVFNNILGLAVFTVHLLGLCLR